jgi:hypothetical protein
MEEGVKYEFFHQQTDHHLVQEYFSLRNKAFKEQWGLSSFSSGEDQYDKDAIIIIAHKNGICLGGGRLIIHEVDSGLLLPIETDNFRLINIFPELGLDRCKYAALSRVAIINECRNGQYSKELYRQLTIKSYSLGLSYVFCVTKMQLARASRINLRKIGLPFEIKTEIKVPDLPTYEGHQMFLSLIDLTKVSTTEYQELEKVEDFA